MCEAALDDPPLAAQAGAMPGSASGDYGRDPERPQELAVLVEVIATVGKNTVGFLARTAGLAGDRP